MPNFKTIGYACRLLFMSVFVSVRKDKKKENRTKKLSQFFKSHISGMLEVMSLQFSLWSTGVGGRVHSKNRLVS